MFYYCVLNKNSSSCFNWYWYWRRWKRLTSFWERQTGAASVTLIVHLHLNKRTRAACLEFWKVFATTSNSLTPWPLNGLTLRDQNSCRWTSDQLAEKWLFLTLPGLIFVIGNVPLPGLCPEADALPLHWEPHSGCDVICGASIVWIQLRISAVYWK